MSDETNTEKEKNQQDVTAGFGCPESVGLIGSSLTAAYLIVMTIILIIFLVQCWPSPETPTNASTPSKAGFLFLEFLISFESRLILIVVLTGALGAQVRSLRSLAWYTGNRILKRSWVLQYILSPFIGATLAIITYFIIRGAFFSAGSTMRQSSVYIYAGIASIVGIAAEPVSLKLKQVAESLFTKPREGSDPGPRQ